MPSLSKDVITLFAALISLSKLVKSSPGGSHVKSLKGKIFQEKNPGKSYPDSTSNGQAIRDIHGT